MMKKTLSRLGIFQISWLTMAVLPVLFFLSPLGLINRANPYRTDPNLRIGRKSKLAKAT